MLHTAYGGRHPSSPASIFWLRARVLDEIYVLPTACTHVIIGRRKQVGAFSCGDTFHCLVNTLGVWAAVTGFPSPVSYLHHVI